MTEARPPRPGSWAAGGDGEDASIMRHQATAMQMLRSHREEVMRAYLVSSRVDGPKNDDARCLEPAE